MGGLPTNNKQQDMNDGKIVTTSYTDSFNDRYVHCWQLCFHQLGIGSDGTATKNNNDNTNTISPILCGIIPTYEAIGNDDRCSTVKIVALPYGSNNYSFCILEFWTHWWDDCAENLEEYM